MPIFYDPSEARAGTRLHKGIVESGSPVENLEKYTGADLLVSPLQSPKLTKVSDSLPHLLALEKHCKHGLLLQRKTGRDLVNSIPKYSNIIYRMFEWTQRPWLIAIADIKSNNDGYCVIDGKVTNWTYNNLQGALEHWQLRGGYYSILGTDVLFTNWINRWILNLDKIYKNGDSDKMLIDSKVIRNHLKIGEGGSWPILAAFNDVGPVKAMAIWEYCGKSLAQALWYCSDKELWKNGTPDGVGIGTLESIYESLELNGMKFVVTKGSKKDNR